ncbi:S8 family serine peptidase [Nocardia sp. NPDC056611]|uniref:S8 family serine peptidase n=1 Tax=Nocardia sp. NPDC056611 TaxID=3345877 RepID=UPI003672D236
MKKTWLALLVAVLSIPAAGGIPAGAEPAAPAPTISVDRAQPGRGIPDVYVVSVKQGANIDDVLSQAKIKETRVKSAALRSFAAKLTKPQVEALQRNSSVEMILEDRVVTSTSSIEGYTPTDEPGPGWATDRINQAALPLDGSYTTNATGAGVTAYVIDGGIDVNHPDFEGRASEGTSLVDTAPTPNCGGYQHGTGVAGVLGGAKFGVAKKVKLVSVRTTGCDGGASLSTVLAAAAWVGANHQKPAVVNVSFNINGTGSLEDIATATILRGVFNALSADLGLFIANSTSNRNLDACMGAPADAAGVVAVAHTDIDDRAADSADWGPCIQLYAPGRNVPFPAIGSGFVKSSGSSFAAPMVAGVGALYKSAYGDAPSQTVTNWIKDKSTKDVVKPKLNPYPNPNVIPTPTVNRLLNTGGL